ncbi:MAG: glycoside hydrolase domain-containing protein [Bacteroides cellulosilyticus]
MQPSAHGDRHEAEGRGGLIPYLELGYIPYGIPRAGNRTVEYSYCDYAIALVAKGLGKEGLYQHYLKQSGNWKNLWRDDYEHAGAKGFILPRDEKGNWLDEITFGKSKIQKPTFTYTPVTFEGPWYTPWWDMFFYEASSWEYSLSMSARCSRTD